MTIQSPACSLNMKNALFSPLYSAFEGLFLNCEPSFPNKVAIWHVPDPRKLADTEKIPTLKKDSLALTDHSFQTYYEVGVSSITFTSLLSMASLVAMRLTQVLRARGCTWVGKVRKSSQASPSLPTEAAAQASTIVAIFMPPGIHRIVAQVACIQLQLAYLPLDCQLSVSRMADVLRLVSPVVVILSRDYHNRIFTSSKIPPSQMDRPGSEEQKTQHSGFFSVSRLESFRHALVSIPIEIFDNLLVRTPESDSFQNSAANNGSFINDKGGVTAEAHGSAIHCVTDPVVVVLLTSGSTASGPKVVRLRNSQLMNRLRWQWESHMEENEYGQWRTTYRTENPTEVALASTACVFVDAFTELFSALFAGVPVVAPGCADCASEVCVSDVRVLYNLIRVFQITRLTTVPNQLKIWMDQMNLISSNGPASSLDSLRTVVVSGDTLLPELASHFFRLFTGQRVRLINLYGTTEVAGDVTAAVLHSLDNVMNSTKHVHDTVQVESLAEAVSFITVGKPISNTSVCVVKKCEKRLNKRVSENHTENKEHSGSTSTNENADNGYMNSTTAGELHTEIDWTALGYERCAKGCVGEVAILGIPVGETKLTNLSQTQTIKLLETSETHSTQSHESSLRVYFPGDLGFISPEDNLLYICGRLDELVKINAVGFLAGDVDRLLARIKEESLKHPQKMSAAELKFATIRESMTVPIQHPLNKDLQLACFYVVSSACASPFNSPSVSSVTAPENSVNFTTSVNIINPQFANWEKEFPKPNEMTTVTAHYLPIYIRPIFVRVDRIPVMLTSGKVDKQRLRTLYTESIVATAPNITVPLNEQTCDVIGAGHKKNADELRESDAPGVQDNIEQARRVLARTLGIQTAEIHSETQRPRDDEDFFLLGGTSLTAVLALERLRQLGFSVRLETFYHTGNIGQILNSLIPSNYDSSLSTSYDRGTSCWEPTPMNKSCENDLFTDSEDIFVHEWTEVGTRDCTVCVPSRSDLLKLLVDQFECKDQVSCAFRLSRNDLETAASTYLKPGGNGIVLTATYSPQTHMSSCCSLGKKLVGVLLSVPTKNLPNLLGSPSLSKLQTYFDFCGSIEQPIDYLTETSLTTIMVGVQAPTADDGGDRCQSIRARWNRVTLEIVARLESQLLQVAKANNFTVVETLNTNEVTKEVCAELGYVLLKSTRMQTFAESQHMELDPKFYDKQCYYMVKFLND